MSSDSVAHPTGSQPAPASGHARLVAGADAVDFLDDRGSVLVHCTKLMVNDARGARLPAQLRTSGATLTIEVDDDAAVYPIVIDPLLGAGWTTEGNQADASFGAAVTILDIQGRRIASLVDAPQQTGTQSISGDGHDSSGCLVRPAIYCVRLQAGVESVTKKFVRE